MSRNSGHHLTYEERCQIQVLKRNDYSVRGVAKALGRNHSVISREIKRNSGLRGYRIMQAQLKAKIRRHKASAKPKKLMPHVVQRIKFHLEETDASPEQISGRLKLTEGIHISHETIYQFILADKNAGGSLYKRLRHQHKKYNKRFGKKAGRGLIPNRVDIDERPAIVNEKSRVGDLEYDTVVGAMHKGVVVTAVDRRSKYSWLKREFCGTAINIENALCSKLEPLVRLGLYHTGTADNGKEFARHEAITERIGGAFYFAKPYHSWERGLNEHTNGLLRQYFPKGTDFTLISDEDLEQAEWKINNRPRKSLGYRTPSEVMMAAVQARLAEMSVQQ
jgi:IS30 family transposase